MTTSKAGERRTFAISSHPDAGKTTLTEKLLLFGGAIHAAGEVRARGQARRARSDWMKIEQQRGISVTSSVMTFERQGITFNLLDTPGHEDFSEDTYRTLTAVDSAVMVIDAARGIEAQTRRSLANLAAVLEAGGASLASIAKTTVFLKDMNDFAAMNAVYAEHFPDAPAARSTVEVARLPRDALVEVEAIAVATGPAR